MAPVRKPAEVAASARSDLDSGDFAPAIKEWAARDSVAAAKAAGFAQDPARTPAHLFRQQAPRRAGLRSGRGLPGVNIRKSTLPPRAGA